MNCEWVDISIESIIVYEVKINNKMYSLYILLLHCNGMKHQYKTAYVHMHCSKKQNFHGTVQTSKLLREIVRMNPSV